LRLQPVLTPLCLGSLFWNCKRKKTENPRTLGKGEKAGKSQSLPKPEEALAAGCLAVVLVILDMLWRLAAAFPAPKQMVSNPHQILGSGNWCAPLPLPLAEMCCPAGLDKDSVCPCWSFCVVAKMCLASLTMDGN